MALTQAFYIDLNSHKKGGFNEDILYWADGSSLYE